MRKRAPDYKPEEDRKIVTLNAAGWTAEAIASALGRKPKSVQDRIYLLRKKGVISGFELRKATAARKGQAIGKDVPPLVLSGDDHLVETTRAQGGFPRAVQTSIGTVWAAPDGMPWRYGRPVAEVRA